MFNPNNNPFVCCAPVPQSAKVIFVADMFVEDYVGGAELTTQALIDSAPFEVHKIKSSMVTMETLRQGMNKFWVFGNFAQLNPQLIPSIVANLRYSVLEYDYKYCSHRSPEKHLSNTGTPCNCHDQVNGKLISAFYYGAMCLWWMSEKQKQRYHALFPFLAEKDNVVLSSVFSYDTLAKLKILRSNVKDSEREGWIVLGSQSWIKGFDDAVAWCKKNEKKYEIVWNLPYEQLLQKLAGAEGFVYLPKGGDTCPRMVIEAKLLGCKLVINEHVQHACEDWFDTNDYERIESYLFAAHGLFWKGTKKMMEFKPSISGYTTTYNCASQEYPFEQSVQSMLTFCDEVCIVDGGSTDDTLRKLALLKYPQMIEPLTGSTTPAIDEILPSLLSSAFPDKFGEWNVETRIKIKVIPRDWSSPRFAVFDGMQKTEARSMCTKDFCWQMDSDEVIHEDDVNGIIEMCRAFPPAVDIISLPVIEYWGGNDKVRVDILPWKWRLSRNKKNIIHGIPKSLRKFDEHGNLCALPGTDGCDMIDATTFEPLYHVSFYTPEVENARRAALNGDMNALTAYESWFGKVVGSLPSVFHYSWYDLKRKIKLYRDYWTMHWIDITGEKYVDSVQTNMMFDIPWKDVTDEMIDEKVEQLKGIGGWIWHRKWDGTKTPYISCSRIQPRSMVKFYAT